MSRHGPRRRRGRERQRTRGGRRERGKESINTLRFSVPVRGAELVLERESFGALLDPFSPAHPRLKIRAVAKGTRPRGMDVFVEGRGTRGRKGKMMSNEDAGAQLF